MHIASIELYPTDPFIYIVVPEGVVVAKGMHVIVRMPEGAEEAGSVQGVLKDYEPDTLPDELKEQFKTDISIVRIATEHDLQRVDANARLVDNSLAECEQYVTRHNLNMRLVTAHFSLDGRQVMFVFTAESRVDFRALVKDLAHHFKRRVRLKQIGPRDRARYVGRKYGAYGRCGRPLCCATFLKNLDSVTMETVRSQNLENKGAAKLSGVCGKLMNCLSYEVEMYKDMKKDLPEVGCNVKTKKGQGTIDSYDILTQMVRVQYSDQTSEYLHVKDAQVIQKT